MASKHSKFKSIESYKPFDVVHLGIALALLGSILAAACDPPRPSDSPTGVSQSIEANSKAKIAIPASGDVVLIGGWSSGNKSTAAAEFFDPNTKKFSKTGSMAVSAGAGVAALVTMSAQSEILVAGGFGGSSKFTKKTVSQSISGAATSNLQLFDPQTGTFGAAVNLLMPRLGATATALVSGKVLIAGGGDSSGNPANTAEVYDPATGMTAATANNMSSSRMFHTATLLNDGTVLLAGGATDNVGDLTATADIYDPSSNQFTPATGAMSIARAAHATVLLTTGTFAGKVVVTGGVANNSGLLSAQLAIELYDPASKRFGPFGNLNDPRAFHTATELQNGQVLLVGGFSNFNASVAGATGNLFSLFGSNLSSAEVLDPDTQISTCVGGTNGKGGFSCSAAMKEGRGAHTATLFTAGPLQGEVLIAGGLGAKKPNSKASELKEAELYDPTTNSFAKTANMKVAQGLHTAILLP
jgi:hypothetical protein